MDSVNPFLLINRNEGPQGIGIFSLATNESVAGPNFPCDFLYLYSDGAWGLAGKYDVAEEFGQDERCTLILASLEEARGKVTYVYRTGENGQRVIPRGGRTGFFSGNPSTDDYQIFLLEKLDNIVDSCILWISHTIQNPLGDGEVVNENNPVVFNQNGGSILWTCHLIVIEEPFEDAFSLVFWENSIYWISEVGRVHSINLNTLAHTRYMPHPDIGFHDDMRGSGPCAYLSIDHEHHRILYIFTNPNQAWICELFNVGGVGLILPIPHDQGIEGSALFVNRGQSALLKEVEDLNMHPEVKILQGPLPNDCQMYNIETNQWQVIKICAHPICEGLWFFSGVENLGQEHIHYDYVENYPEHGAGAAPPAVVAEEGQGEEEEDVPVVIDNINSCNSFCCDQFTPNSPNKPKIWTENWPGWFQTFGTTNPHRPPEDIAFSVARFFQKGGTVQNYYMYHGGTNFGRTAGGPFITTSYDYDAPIDEYVSVQRQRNYASLLNVPRDVSKLFCAQVKVSDELNSEQEEDGACELVNGHDLVIGEGEDTIHAYLLTAVKNNNGAGVLLLSDIFGFEDSSTRDFAYRVACNGFNVLVPDLFRGNPWGKDRLKSDFDEWIQAQSPLRVSKDIDLCTKWLIDEFKSAGISEKFGLIGFCFGGGRLIETLAHDTSSNFLTGICFYGTRMDPSWSNQIQVPVLFISGDKDPLCPVNVLEEMERNIKGTKLVVYSGRGHGFAHRPESQEEDKDAEDAFGVARNWLQEKLLASSVQSVG